MSDLLAFTGAEAAERIKAGDISAAELFEAYRQRAAAEELNAFLWVADGPDAAAADGPNTATPASRNESANPSTSGASGPITTRPIALSCANAITAA